MPEEMLFAGSHFYGRQQSWLWVRVQGREDSHPVCFVRATPEEDVVMSHAVYSIKTFHHPLDAQLFVLSRILFRSKCNVPGWLVKKQPQLNNLICVCYIQYHFQEKVNFVCWIFNTVLISLCAGSLN